MELEKGAEEMKRGPRGPEFGSGSIMALPGPTLGL